MSSLATPPVEKKDIFLTAERTPRYWTLYFRYGNVPQLTKGFRFDGSMQSAIQRGRDHCKTMQYLFICVRPMIVDLEYQEKVFLAAQERGENEDLFRE